MRRAIQCEVCGDSDVGPWAQRREHLLCECCLDLLIALVAWSGQPGANIERLKRLAEMAAGELDAATVERWSSAFHES